MFDARDRLRRLRRRLCRIERREHRPQPVSRLLSRPTYERVHDVDTDLLVVHAGRP